MCSCQLGLVVPSNFCLIILIIAIIHMTNTVIIGLLASIITMNISVTITTIASIVIPIIITLPGNTL